MKVWSAILAHWLCGALIIGGLQVAAVPLEAQASGQTSATATDQARLENLPDSPGAAQSVTAAPSESQEARDSQSSSSSSQASQPPQTQAQQPQSSPPQNPVGTAAAETTNAGGVTASQPAGVAIAPAKQHRVRTIVIRVGALAAAGVAVGTVAALSRATPSKPPGAH